MTGLLYKDFISIKGKLVTCVAIALLFLTFILRFTFRSEEASVIFLMLYLTYAFGFIALLYFGLSSLLFPTTASINIKRTLFSMPMTKKLYVQEKYIFILIVLYTVTSYLYFEGAILRLFCDTSMDVLLSGFQTTLIFIAGIFLFLFAIEMIFIFSFGEKKGALVKTGGLVIFFFVFIIFILFGDFSALAKFNLDMDHVIEYCATHKDIITFLLITSPIIGALTYGVSYRISLHNFEKREDWFDE